MMITMCNTDLLSVKLDEFNVILCADFENVGGNLPLHTIFYGKLHF
jgi:hypothetical protein